MQKVYFTSLLLLIAGCSSAPVYKEIQKQNDSDNVRIFKTTSPPLQTAVTQMLLSKQFVIDKENKLENTTIASRYFSQSRNNTVIVLQARMFALQDGRQKLFLNAIQTTQRNYIADRTRFLLWLIPLPGGGGKQVSETKESQLTIEDKSFYNDLFDAIGKNLK